eukprot:g56.t1
MEGNSRSAAYTCLFRALSVVTDNPDEEEIAAGSHQAIRQLVDDSSPSSKTLKTLVTNDSGTQTTNPIQQYTSKTAYHMASAHIVHSVLTKEELNEWKTVHSFAPVMRAFVMQRSKEVDEALIRCYNERSEEHAINYSRKKTVLSPTTKKTKVVGTLQSAISKFKTKSLVTPASSTPLLGKRKQAVEDLKRKYTNDPLWEKRWEAFHFCCTKVHNACKEKQAGTSVIGENLRQTIATPKPDVLLQKKQKLDQDMVASEVQQKKTVHYTDNQNNTSKHDALKDRPTMKGGTLNDIASKPGVVHDNHDFIVSLGSGLDLRCSFSPLSHGTWVHVDRAGIQKLQEPFCRCYKNKKDEGVIQPVIADDNMEDNDSKNKCRDPKNKCHFVNGDV